jgi:hypothetical protein
MAPHPPRSRAATHSYSRGLRGELEAARLAHQSGNLAGLWTALDIFREQHTELVIVDDAGGRYTVAPRDARLPKWLYKALLAMLADYFAGSKAGRDLAHGWSQDQEDYLRWGWVETGKRVRQDTLRRLRNEPSNRELRLRLESTTQKKQRQAPGLHASVAQGLDRLQRHGYAKAVSGEAVNRSHRLVARRRKAQPERYYAGRLNRRRLK